MNTVYVLLLEKGKYYIGKTKNKDVRINSHFAGDGSVWTKKYNPIKVVEIIENAMAFDELRYTLLYMQNYGIKNVRGASFCEKRFSKDKIKFINEIILGEEDRCYVCKSLAHFKGECQATQNVYSKVEKEMDKSQKNEQKVCDKCGLSFSNDNIYISHKNICL